MRATLASQRLRKPRAVGVAVTDSRRVRRLNRRFRGIDEATDVLSFNTDFPAISRPDGARELGEIVIALPARPRAARARAGLPLADELALLTVHGVLHLLGHDHETPREDAEMRRLERAALHRIGRPQGRPPAAVNGGQPPTLEASDSPLRRTGGSCAAPFSTASGGPRDFDSVAGQDAVVRTLQNAVAQDKISHAYLFCGPRGTGKTTTARILARAINGAAPSAGSAGRRRRRSGLRPGRDRRGQQPRDR